MAIIILKDDLTSKDVEKAREDYEFYIKITVDIEKQVVALGGEYHAVAENVLIEKYDCKSKNICGGGYTINTRKFETNAVINLRPPINTSMEIIDPDGRKKYIELVQEKLKCIDQLI